MRVSSTSLTFQKLKLFFFFFTVLKSDYANGVFGLKTTNCPLTVQEADHSFVKLEVHREWSFYGSVEVVWTLLGEDATEEFRPSNGSLIFHEDQKLKVRMIFIKSWFGACWYMCGPEPDSTRY